MTRTWTFGSRFSLRLLSLLAGSAPASAQQRETEHPFHSRRQHRLRRYRGVWRRRAARRPDAAHRSVRGGRPAPDPVPGRT